MKNKISKKRHNSYSGQRRKRSFKEWTQQPHFYGALAMLLPLTAILIAYIAMGVFPFGDQATMIIDSYHQYVPFFSEFHDKIWHGESFLYSWHGSLGFNFIAVQAYYLASPLNFLIAIFPASMMIEAFETLIILKICLSGWTAYRYLRRRTGRNDYSTVVFAAFYALGGFSIAYNWNVMWLDSIVLFPLILMGMERLINDKNGLLYVVTMGLAIFCNYYMAIMICIFVVLYFFVIWFSRKREGVGQFFKSGFHFAVCSVLAGGLAGIYLFPTYYTLINSSQGSAPTSFKLYRNFLEIFRQQFALVEPTELTGAPNIYCGVLLVMLVVFYAVSKNISLREKIGRLLVTGFVLVSLNINVLDYVWHGFHFPNNLPGRFSFIYIFMVVVMAYDAWQSLRLMNMKAFLGIFAAEAVLFGVCLWYPKDRLPLYSMIVTGILMALYMILLVAYRRHSFLMIKGYKVLPQMLCLLVLTIEVAGNAVFGLCMNGTVNRTSYTEDRQEVSAIRNHYEAKDTFYRMELAQIRGRDDVTWHHLNGMSFFSSTADDREERLMGALGFYNSGNKYSYKGATPLTDALLGIRYIISNEEMWASNLSLCEQTMNKYVYENQQNLALGYMVNPTLEQWKIVEGDPFVTQNDFVRLATDTQEALFTPMTVSEPEVTGGMLTSTGEDKYFYERTADNGTLTWQLTFTEQQDVYIYFEASHCEKLKVTIDGETETYSDKRGHIVHLGQCDAGKVVTLDFPMDNEYDTGNVKLQMYAFNNNVFESAYTQLADAQLQVTDYDSTHVTGSIQASQDGLMLLSVPYDEGWSVYVDGVKTEISPVGEALTGCWLTAGTHEITMRYVPQGFVEGAVLSTVSLLILVLGIAVKSGIFRKHHRKM